MVDDQRGRREGAGLSERARYDAGKVEAGVTSILDGLCADWRNDRNFAGTPLRVARSYREILSGMVDTEGQVNKILSVSFPSSCSQMVVAKGISTYGLCPHHLLPVKYSVSVAYLPSKGGDVLGVSKLVRLVEILAHRPILQEQLMEDVVDALMRLKWCLGAGCVGRGEHYCMLMRGVRQPNAEIVSSALRGDFLNDAAVRAEFMSLVKG